MQQIFKRSRWPESDLQERGASFVRGERVEKHPHRRPVPARRHQRKIIVLFGKSNKAEIGRMGDGRDNQPPIGAALRHRCCDRVVRTRLIPVAVRACVTEQPEKPARPVRTCLSS